MRLRQSVDRIAGPALAALLTMAVTAYTLQLWEWRPGTPFGMRGDEVFVHAQIRTTLETGWFWTNDRLGRPFEMAAYLFPETSILQLGLIKAIGGLVADPFSLGFLYFLLGFPLSAIAFYWLARSEGLTRSASVVTSVLFAMAPGHQLQYGHLWLASLWVVPIVLWLALRVLRGRLWSGSRWVVGCALLLVGLSNIYYAAFAMLLIGCMAVVGMLSRRASLLQGFTAAALIGAPAAGHLVVARLAARSQTVTGPLPATRVPSESERYAGKLMDLLLPWTDHRWDLASTLTQVYNAFPGATVERVALGLMGVLGLVLLAAVSAQRLAARDDGSWVPSRELDWSLVAMSAFLFYTVGGLGSFIGFFVSPQLRTWSRWSIFILAVALLAIGSLLSRLSLHNRRTGMAVAGLVAVVGVLDQTNPHVAPDYAAERARLADLRSYTDRVASDTGGECAVLQLPIARFPEAPPRTTTRGYDQLMPYVASDSDLTWSFGAMSGTASADWQLALDPTDLEQLLEDAAAVDFCAVEVDTEAYRLGETTSGAPVASPASDLTRFAGDPIARTEDGRFVAFAVPATDLTQPELQERRQRVLGPAVVSVGGQPGYEVSGSTGNVVGPNGRISVANLGEETVPLDIGFMIEPTGPEPRNITVTYDGRALAESVLPPGELTEVTVSIEAPAGLSSVQLEVSGELELLPREDRKGSGIIRDLTVRGPALSRVVSLQENRWP